MASSTKKPTKRRRLISDNENNSSDTSDNGDTIQSSPVGVTTRSQTKKGGRSEPEKKQSLHNYNHKCIITGVRGPGVEVAHFIQFAELSEDSRYNMAPLRADLHKEYDALNPLWAFDPATKSESSKRGCVKYGIIHSDKGDCDYCSSKDFTGMYDIRKESEEFIVEAYKRFIESEFPEDIECGLVEPPTRPYKSQKERQSNTESHSSST